MKKNLLLLTFVSIAMLSMGQKVPFQGKLIESENAVEGTRTFVFEISAVGWTETHADVSVTDGLYFVVLGSINLLPENLFNAADEQSLEITVDGTALSPVILFKPFMPEYQGDKLQVRNNDGTVVGSLHARVESADQNGEMVISGSNGNPNVVAGGYGDGGNNGLVSLHNSLGDDKVFLGAGEKAGGINLNGETSGKMLMRLYDDQNGNADLPSIAFANEKGWYARMYMTETDNNTSGRFWLASDGDDWNRIQSDGYFLERDGKPMSSLFSHDIGGKGNSGFHQLFGPNSPNIQMGGLPWGSPDLGFFELSTDKPDGNGGYYEGARIEAGNDGTDSWGRLTLFNNDQWNIILDGHSGDINIAGTLNQSSDLRLKKDVVKLSNALDKLTKLQGVLYYWKSDKLNTKPQIGLIAQEVEKVYPEFVATKDDGFKALNYSQMVAVLIEATKELNAKVEKLETENSQLKAELSASTSNTSEIDELKEQMQTLFKMVELQQTEATSEDHTSTPGLK